MSEEKQAYTGIFKSTFLFGFVQVFNILVKMIANKAVALLLGANGMGIVGLFNSSIGMIQTGAGLGLSQSAVRDISEANASEDTNRFSRIISLTNRVLLFTAFLGVIVTISLSPWLSEWSFGNKNYTFAYIWLSIVVGLNILTEGQLAILKGMRRLRALAKASMIGAIVGLFTVVPFYYFFKEKGIVPVLVVTAMTSLFFSNFFVRKIKYDKQKLSIKDLYKEASPMVKMGIALAFTNFLASLASLIVANYISTKGGLADVAFYNAGVTIMYGYFGVIINALSTDYYPRIAAINKDNNKLTDELNRQSAVSLVLSFPIIVLFLFLLPFFVTLLYSNEFFPVINFVKAGIFGTLIVMISNPVDMILVAKFNMKVFTFIASLYRVIQVLLSIFLYKFFGLVGMGYTLSILGLIHLIIMTFTVYKLYRIKFNSLFVKIAIVVLVFTIFSVYICSIENNILKYSIGLCLLLFASVYSLTISKKYFELDFIEIIKKKIKRQ